MLHGDVVERRGWWISGTAIPRSEYAADAISSSSKQRLVNSRGVGAHWLQDNLHSASARSYRQWIVATHDTNRNRRAFTLQSETAVLQAVAVDAACRAGGIAD